MQQNPRSFNNSFPSMAVLVISIGVCIYWLTGTFINIYQSRLLGTIFEMLWLPMLGLLFILPVLCLVKLIKINFNLRSFYLHSLLMIALTYIIMVSRNWFSR